MFKTVAAKMLVLVAFVTAGFVTVCCLVLYSSMKSDRIEESVHQANDISSLVLKATRYSMLKEDRETLHNIVRSVGEESRVKHVRIFNKKGVVVFSGEDAEEGRKVDERAEGCAVCHAGQTPAKSLGPMEQARRFVDEKGNPVMAITAAIYNEPGCSDGGCHRHPPQQAVLGTLDIGLSEAPLVRNLGVMSQRLAVFSGMLVLLVVGGVAALLQMNVVMPLKRVVAYMRAVAVHDTSVEEPAVEGEFDEVIKAVRKTHGKLGWRD